MLLTCVSIACRIIILHEETEIQLPILYLITILYNVYKVIKIPS